MRWLIVSAPIVITLACSSDVFTNGDAGDASSSDVTEPSDAGASDGVVSADAAPLACEFDGAVPVGCGAGETDCGVRPCCVTTNSYACTDVCTTGFSIACRGPSDCSSNSITKTCCIDPKGIGVTCPISIEGAGSTSCSAACGLGFYVACVTDADCQTGKCDHGQLAINPTADIGICQ